MKKPIILTTSVLFMALGLVQCSQSKQEPKEAKAAIIEVKDFGGYASAEEWGEHLVITSGCHNCHSPKKMSENGPVLDSSRMLSGHPADMAKLDVDRGEMASKGLVVTTDLTEWVGPWGTSYTANLTPHKTGLGTWTEEQFFKALREGKYKGLDNSRGLLPPMPWKNFSKFSDKEIKAIFAYLKSIPPVDNLVPQAILAGNSVQP